MEASKAEIKICGLGTVQKFLADIKSKSINYKGPFQSLLQPVYGARFG